MWVGNVMSATIDTAMIGLWVKLSTLPYRLLHPSCHPSGDPRGGLSRGGGLKLSLH
jgi:hypothetical protein